MYNSENRKNITVSTSDSYEMKIGDTIYVVSHEYGTADLFDIAADYISEKSIISTDKTA